MHSNVINNSIMETVLLYEFNVQKSQSKSGQSCRDL